MSPVRISGPFYSSRRKRTESEGRREKVEEEEKRTNGVESESEGSSSRVGSDGSSSVVDDALVVLVRSVREVHSN